jgi:hypothetical protein
VSLTTVRRLAPHLTSENHQSVLEAATGKTTREVDEIVACIQPKPGIPTTVRRLRCSTPATAQVLDPPAWIALNGCDVPAVPTQAPATASTAPPRRAVAPLAPDRYKLTVTIDGGTVDKLRAAQDLLRHALPTGTEAEIIDRALTLLLEDLARKKFAATPHPRQGRDLSEGSRHIPAEVKRAVWLRDLGRAPSWPSRAVVARSEASSSSITSSRTRPAERPRSRTFRCAASSTTVTRQSCASGRDARALRPQASGNPLHRTGGGPSGRLVAQRVGRQSSLLLRSWHGSWLPPATRAGSQSPRRTRA